MRNAFARFSQKSLGGTTINLAEKVRSDTLEFGPHKIMSMTKGLLVDPELKLSPATVDVYYRSMPLFAILTNGSIIDPRNYFGK